MTVGEFIDTLLSMYDKNDVLYFTTCAGGNEHVFDEILVQPKDDNFNETDVYLTFNNEHMKEFISEITDEWSDEFREDLKSVIDNYL